VAPTTGETRPSWLHALMEHGSTYGIAIHYLGGGGAWLQIGIGLILLVSNGRTGRIVGGVFGGVGGPHLAYRQRARVDLHLRRVVSLWLARGHTLLLVAGAWLFVKPDTFRRFFSTVTLRFLSVVLVFALSCSPYVQRVLARAATPMPHGDDPPSDGIAQPHWLAWAARHVGSLSASMGGGFNLVVIMWLLCAREVCGCRGATLELAGVDARRRLRLLLS